MWRGFFAAPRNCGFGPARKADAPAAGPIGGGREAMSAPQDRAADPVPAPSVPADRVAPSAPAGDRSPRATPRVSRETSDELDTPIGAAAERAMRIIHT